MKKVFKKVLIIALLIVAFTSCEDDSIESGHGTLTVKLTDDPFPFNYVTEAKIGIAKIELKNAAGEYVVVFEGNSNHNMVGLTNGVTKKVANTKVKEGTYSNARITLNAASAKLTNGTSFEMNAEAQESYTISINPVLEIKEDNNSEILFDLDISDSFKFTGTWIGNWVPNVASILGCHFNAHFRACDLNKTGKIEGQVTVSGSAIENAYVYILVNGEEISTQTEANGSFTFIGIADGSYTVSVKTKTNGTKSVSNVKVNGTETATCSLDL